MVRNRVHRTRPEHGEQTRAALLGVARELFANEGYGAVALDEVCARAGVTRGALYHHFSSKEELFRAVCEEVAGEVSERVLEAGARESDPGSACARAACASSTCLPMRRCAGSSCPTRPRCWDGRSSARWTAATAWGCCEGRCRRRSTAGAIEPAPVDALAHLLVGALNEASMVVARSSDPDRARREAAEGVERMLAGIAGSRGPA